MAADTPASGSGDQAAVEARLDELNRKLEQVNAANSSAKVTSRLIAVVIVIVAVFGVYLLVQPFISAFRDEERKQEYMTALQSELEERVLPLVQEEARASLKTAGPEVADLVWKRVKEREEDVVKAVDLEAGLFVENLQAFTEQALADAVVNVQLHIEQTLADKYPELTDEETRTLVLGNATNAVESAVQRTVDERLGDHLQKLSVIETKLAQFPIPDPVAQMSDTELSEEMNRALAEYAILTLSQTLSPEAKDTLSRLAEEPNQ